MTGLLDRFRRRRESSDSVRLERNEYSGDPDDALYVHLAEDGGILLIRGQGGEQLWTDRAGLRAEIEALKKRKGLLLYSREGGDREPPQHVEETFEMIVALEPPAIQLVEDPHPEAKVPPSERRTLTRERLDR